MSQVAAPPRIYVSGERVEPGTYRDVASGAIVDIREPDSLPEDLRIVRSMRLYERIEKEYRPCGRPSE